MNNIASDQFGSYSLPGTYIVKEKFSRGIALSGAIGARVLNPIRIELEFGYSKNNYEATMYWDWDFDERPQIDFPVTDTNYDSSEQNGLIDDYSHLKTNGSLTSWSLMGNAYYDIKINDKFKLLIGAGLGRSSFKLRLNASQGYVYGDSDIKESDVVFAYQFIGGLSYDVTEKTTIELQYRYKKTKTPDFLLSDSFYHQGVSVGLRKSF